jgi:hypothetical protein
LLQIVGFCLLLVGLHGTLRQFGYPSLLATLWSWAKQWASTRPRFSEGETVLGSGTSAIVFSGRARGRATAGSGATLEQRIGVLEQNMDALHKEVGDVQDKFKREVDALRKLLADETAERMRDTDNLTSRLKAKFVDGIGLDLLGIWFFILGITLGTASVEIAGYFAK